MFNSFYESLPPVHLGKTKFVALFSFYVVYLITFFVFLGLIIASFISSDFSILKDFVVIALGLILSYSVFKIFLNVYKILINAWLKSVFKLTYNNLLILKKGLFFQFALLVFTISYKLILNSTYAFSNTMWIILLIIIFIFAMENLGLYLGYNSILKPYRSRIQENLFKFGNQQKTATQYGHSTTPFSSTNSFFKQKQSEEDQKFHKVNKNEEEQIARSANVPVIDISNELNEKKLSTIDKDNDKNKEDEKSSKEDSSNSGISAF